MGSRRKQHRAATIPEVTEVVGPAGDSEGDSAATPSQPLAGLDALSQAEMLDAVLSASTDYIYLTDRDGRFLYVGRSGARALGLDPVAMIGKTAREFGLPEDLMVLADETRAAVFATGQPVRGRTAFPMVQGLRDFEYTYSPIMDGAGNVVAIVGVAHDVTAFTRVERQLRETADQIRLITDAAPLLISYVDTDLRYRFVNQAYADWFGHPVAAILGKRISEVSGEVAFEEIRPHVESALRGERVTYEAAVAYRDGGPRYIHAELISDKGEDGRVRGVVAVVVDMTARRSAERQMEESEQRYRSLFEHNPDAVYSFDLAGNFVSANTACERLTGYSRAELLGMAFDPLVVPDVRERTIEHFRRAAEGESQNYETAILHKDGRRVELNATKIPIRVGGAVVGVFGIAKDVTERNAASAALNRHAEDLALLYEAGRRIGQTLDLVAVYDTFRAMVARAMDCDGLLVSEFTPETEQIRCVYAWVERNHVDVSGFPVLQLAPQGGGLQSDTIRSGEPLLVNDFPAHMRAHRALYFPNAEGVVEEAPDPSTPITQSILMVPIILDGRVLGVVQAQSHREGAYTLEQLKLLEAMTLQVAAASRNAYLYHEAREEIAERKRVEAENARLLEQVEQAAQQQRAFLREILASVTEGRLRLCNTTTDLPRPLMPFGAEMALSASREIRHLRRRAEDAAHGLGFSNERWQDLVTAVGEAAMNAVVHGGGGTGKVYVDPTRSLVQVWVTDEGTGIDVQSLPRATLELGFSSAGTLGHGFWLMLNTIDRIYLLTGATGTTVVLEQERAPLVPTWRASAERVAI
jgi:PAS domain S-box-containing protein